MRKNSIRINELKSSLQHLATLEVEEEPLYNQMLQSSAEKQDIAIIGISCKFGEAEHLNAYWELLAEGKEGIRELPIQRKKDADSYLEFCGKNKKPKKYPI